MCGKMIKKERTGEKMKILLFRNTCEYVDLLCIFAIIFLNYTWSNTLEHLNKTFVNMLFY